MQALHHLSLRPFSPPKWLKNRHLQTILPKFIKQPIPNYQRETHFDSSGEVLVAYDFVFHSTKQNQKTLAVMFHGLEGGSDSHYAKSFANGAKRHGFDAVVVHYRGCGGMQNPSAKDYNAGDTTEIHHVLTNLQKRYDNLVAIGVSLGGNLLARYMGEYGENALCQGAVIASAPVDLTTSAVSMHRFVARHVYTPYLLNSLLKKVQDKIDDPELLKKIKEIKTLDKFDDLYTAPRHGYGTGQNYYQQASALPVLTKICKPTLIITAKDDPFLGKIANPSDISPAVRLLYSECGGHVGFLGFNKQSKRFDNNWLSETTFTFFNWLSSSDKKSQLA